MEERTVSKFTLEMPPLHVLLSHGCRLAVLFSNKWRRKPSDYLFRHIWSSKGEL